MMRTVVRVWSRSAPSLVDLTAWSVDWTEEEELLVVVLKLVKLVKLVCALTLPGIEPMAPPISAMPGTNASCLNLRMRVATCRPPTSAYRPPVKHYGRKTT